VTSVVESVLRKPDADESAALARTHFERRDGTELWGRALHVWREEMRAALGLPTTKPVVMTGHQAGIWHAGIAEKFLLGEAVARAIDGVLVHVVVDHDANDASLIAFPALVEDAHGVRRLERLFLERSPRSTSINALRKPVRTMRPERHCVVPPAIEPALAAIESAIASEYRRENLAMQMAHAANRLLAPRARVEHTIAASTLASLPIAECMRANFASMRDTYNVSVASERIAPLATHELPFWKLDPASGTRIPLSEYSPSGQLAPRALTLTAIARLVLCDLFIHGTGGGHYDLAMERWIGAACGDKVREALAPMSVATATKFAPIAEFVPPFDADATPAALRALEQDPFGDFCATKNALRARIVGLKSERRAAYVAMRRAIMDARTEHAASLRLLRARIDANRDALRQHELAIDRTWPFPLAAC
jgi:hypothetical protein